MRGRRAIFANGQAGFVDGFGLIQGGV